MKQLPWIIACVASIAALVLSVQITRLQHQIRAIQMQAMADDSQGSLETIGFVGKAPTEEQSGDSPGVEFSPPSDPPIETNTPETVDDETVENAPWAEAVLRMSALHLHQEAQQQTDAEYAEFFRELALEPELHEAVREVITAAIMERTEFERNGVTIGERRWIYDEASARLERELPAILTREEMDQLCEFNATHERRTLETGFEIMMLRAQTGLDPDHR